MTEESIDLTWEMLHDRENENIDRFWKALDRAGKSTEQVEAFLAEAWPKIAAHEGGWEGTFMPTVRAIADFYRNKQTEREALLSALATYNANFLGGAIELQETRPITAEESELFLFAASSQKREGYAYVELALYLSELARRFFDDPTHEAIRNLTEAVTGAQVNIAKLSHDARRRQRENIRKR